MHRCAHAHTYTNNFLHSFTIQYKIILQLIFITYKLFKYISLSSKLTEAAVPRDAKNEADTVIKSQIGLLIFFFQNKK